MSALIAVRILMCTSLLSAAIAVNAHESGSYMQALQESLVSSAVSDFAANGPQPEEVRNVHMRYAENDHGARSYSLCGQFLPANVPKAKWTQFATVKTTPYEQWFGGQAEGLCERALRVSEGDEGLTTVLQARLSASSATTGQP